MPMAKAELWCRSGLTEEALGDVEAAWEMTDRAGSPVLRLGAQEESQKISYVSSTSSQTSPPPNDGLYRALVSNLPPQVHLGILQAAFSGTKDFAGVEIDRTSAIAIVRFRTVVAAVGAVRAMDGRNSTPASWRS